MPFLSMVRRALVETRSLIQRFSLATQKRRSCRFGMKRRRVLFMACETLLPVVVRLPVTWHTRAITHLVEFVGASLGQGSGGPAVPRMRTARDAGTSPPGGGAGTGGPESRVREPPCRQRRLETASRALWQCGGRGARGRERAGTGNREREGCRCLPSTRPVARESRGLVLAAGAKRRESARQGSHREPRHTPRSLFPVPRSYCCPAIHSRTCSSSTGSGTEPRASTMSWKALMSKSAPRACSASPRRRMIASSPSWWLSACAGQERCRSTAVVAPCSLGAVLSRRKARACSRGQPLACTPVSITRQAARHIA